MPIIQKLNDTLINQIAAGEVVERPGSVVKELVENSIDSGATRIDVTLIAGGLQLIQVSDNGCGMAPEDMLLSIERHATSKLTNTSNLFDINYLGFRGEALPSIGAISRLQIISRTKDAQEAWSLKVEGGIVANLTPAAHTFGTRIDVKDIFYATPARLNFLKSERSEQMAVQTVFKRLALAHPTIAFSLSVASSLSESPKTILDVDVPALHDTLFNRVVKIIGNDFHENSIEVSVQKENFTLHGYVGLPTLNKRTSQNQYIFVNNRPVQDKVIRTAIRVAYQDVLAHDRHPVYAVYITVPPMFVDINVHPAKSEVRFRHPEHVRGTLITAIKHALTTAGHRTSTTVSTHALTKGQTDREQTPLRFSTPRQAFSTPSHQHLQEASAFQEPAPEYLSAPQASAGYSGRAEPPPESLQDLELPLGIARAQLHQTYIIAQTSQSIIIVDQHAAHERITQENLKEQMQSQSIERQLLLMPEVVELTSHEVECLLEHAEDLTQLGLVIEPFDKGGVIVREVPSILGKLNLKKILVDIAEELTTMNKQTILSEKYDRLIVTMSCHYSIRAGRNMVPEEMNALLRDMETVQLSGQCAHGRPTYLEFKLNDIERLFGRK